MYVSYTYRISYVYVWREGRLSENVGHHGWRITKKFKMTLDKMPQNSPKKTKLHSKNLAHFTSLNSLNITKNIFLEHIQKHVSGWCHKKRKNISTAPFLDIQVLHSRSIWKSNVCIFL